MFFLLLALDFIAWIVTVFFFVTLNVPFGIIAGFVALVLSLFTWFYYRSRQEGNSRAKAFFGNCSNFADTFDCVCGFFK